jgi:hypothetical protein
MIEYLDPLRYLRSPQLRLRDREFPYFQGKPSAKPQPSLMTHVGTPHIDVPLPL